MVGAAGRHLVWGTKGTLREATQEQHILLSVVLPSTSSQQLCKPLSPQASAEPYTHFSQAGCSGFLQALGLA